MKLTHDERQAAVAYLENAGITGSDSTTALAQIEARHPDHTTWPNWIRYLKFAGGIPDDIAIKIYGSDAARAVLVLRDNA